MNLKFIGGEQVEGITPLVFQNMARQQTEAAESI
jgi:hypothetical protein